MFAATIIATTSVTTIYRVQRGGGRGPRSLLWWLVLGAFVAELTVGEVFVVERIAGPGTARSSAATAAVVRRGRLDRS